MASVAITHLVCRAQIPIAPAAPPPATSRGFLPCRLSDAGPKPRCWQHRPSVTGIRNPQQTRKSGHATGKSALPRQRTSSARPVRSVVPIADSCTAAKRVDPSVPASTVYSGNPAFRRPSVTSCAFDCPPQALHPDIVKAGLTSSRRAAASRASASHPRWTKADARQR